MGLGRSYRGFSCNSSSCRDANVSDAASGSNINQETAPAAEQVVEGNGVAPGIAIGTVYCYRSTTPAAGDAHVEADEVQAELEFLDEALQRAEKEFQKVRSVAQDELGADSEAILEAQKMMLSDEEMRQAVRRRIRDQNESAAHALTVVLGKHRRRLENSADAYLRARASDFEDLEGHLLRALQRGKVAATITSSSIVVADQLAAAEIIRFSRHGMLGFVTTEGGLTSHVSIIARALNVPAVVGAEDVTEAVANHDQVILDGREGHLIVHPTAETLDRYRRRRAQHQSVVDVPDAVAEPPVKTSDGHRITLRANVEFGEALDTLDQYGAEGIGLMRTELLFLEGREGALAEAEQEAVYRRAAAATGEHGAVIRLLDLGGDKQLPSAQQQNNPSLGWRGVRVLLDHPDELLRPQLRALLRANAHGSIRVLLPMVSHLNEVRRIQAILMEEADRLDAEGERHDPELPLGVMVEVPAVALQAKAFAEVVDFLSIGTNDLTQYLLAVDRGNDRVADRYDALHPAVLKLVKRTVEAGGATQTPVSLCGELASETYAVPVLVGLGLTTLSVSPSYLPGIQRIVSEIERSEAEGLAEAVCAAPDAATVRRQIREWSNQHIDVERVARADES